MYLRLNSELINTYMIFNEDIMCILPGRIKRLKYPEYRYVVK